MRQLQIHDNIRKLRKDMALTQEQLAEALGVTVGAVSKWETGSTCPDLQMILRLSEFFEVSTDVILGAQVERTTASTVAKRLHAMDAGREFAEGIRYAESALQKHPHDFDVLYQSARLYASKGMEEKDVAATERARTLFQRALMFLPEKGKEKIGRLSLQRQIAMTYSMTGREAKAIEVLKSCNDDGVNDNFIGELYSHDKEHADLALEYLANAMVSVFTELFRIILGCANVYPAKKEYKNALEMMQWIHDILKGVRVTAAPCYIDRMDAIFLMLSGVYHVHLGDEVSAKKAINEAIKMAAQFDAAPVYSLSNMRFVSHAKIDGTEATAHDSLGPSCLEGLNQIAKEFGKGTPGTPATRNDKRFFKLWCAAYEKHYE